MSTSDRSDPPWPIELMLGEADTAASAVTRKSSASLDEQFIKAWLGTADLCPLDLNSRAMYVRFYSTDLYLSNTDQMAGEHLILSIALPRNMNQQRNFSTQRHSTKSQGTRIYCNIISFVLHFLLCLSFLHLSFAYLDDLLTQLI